MRILYAAMQYDYGVKERGFSFEHFNFYEPLVAMGHQVEYFDFMALHQQHGPLQMTQMLGERMKEFRPDLLFVFLFSDQFDHDLLKRIATSSSVPSVNWFADDHWRFDTFSRHWADCFTHVVTTDAVSMERYRAAGYSHAILSQWGVNHVRYSRTGAPMQRDVSFVGQAHGERNAILSSLRKEGIDITVRGTHWDLRLYHRILRKLGVMSDASFAAVINRTRIDQEAMIEMFRTSRINLNLTASSHAGQRNQIKGRTFEIPGCGGFQLSEYAERIEEYFIPDKEIALYRTTGEMIEKIRYYLAHEGERSAVADAGYRRAVKDHTYERRFSDLFRMMGMS